MHRASASLGWDRGWDGLCGHRWELTWGQGLGGWLGHEGRLPELCLHWVLGAAQRMGVADRSPQGSDSGLENTLLAEPAFDWAPGLPWSLELASGSPEEVGHEGG